MKEKKKKKVIPPSGKQQKKVKKPIDPKHQQEQEKLFSDSDSISPINKKIDKTEIELNNGTRLDLDEYVAETYAPKSTHYHKPFYNVIADLLGISRDVMKAFRKIPIVPMLKKKLVYGRFPNATQRKIYNRNPYIGNFARQYWHYQTLTVKGDILLREFIDNFTTEADRVVAAGGNMKQFITEYCVKYKLPIQLNLFDL